MTAFVDTSALYAVLDRDDEFHGKAKTSWANVLSASEPLVTTNYVMVESYALVQSRLGMKALRLLVQDILPALNVEWVSSVDHFAASQALLTANRRSLSLVDCTSFQVMRRLGLTIAFAFDGHFGEQGFRPLRNGTG